MEEKPIIENKDNIGAKKGKPFIFQDICDFDTFGEKNWRNYFIREFQVLILAVKLFNKNSMLSRSSDMAFSMLLSLVPILAVLFMMFKIFGGKEVVDNTIKPYIYGFLTPVGRQQISGYIDGFINSATVETLGSIGVIFLFIAFYAILSQIEGTFNIIWNVKKSRTFLDKLKSYWLIMTVSPILLVVSVSFTGYFSNEITLNESLSGVISEIFIFEVIPFFFILSFFTLIIIALPNYRVKPEHAVVGALWGTVMYYISKELFITYSKLAVSYNIIYGSLAVLPIFMFWIYLFWVIVLLSVQITYVRQNFFFMRNFEKNQEINFQDKVKVSLLIGFKLIQDYLESKKLGNVLDYSNALAIPLNHVQDSFTAMEKQGIVKSMGKTPEVFVPAIPVKDITVKKMVDAAYDMYIPAYTFSNEKLNSMVSSIISSENLFVMPDDHVPLSDLLFQNNQK